MKVDLKPILNRIERMNLETESEAIVDLINVGELLIQYGLATEESQDEFLYDTTILLEKLCGN